MDGSFAERDRNRNEGVMSLTEKGQHHGQSSLIVFNEPAVKFYLSDG
jgi:hypothetical protein